MLVRPLYLYILKGSSGSTLPMALHRKTPRVTNLLPLITEINIGGNGNFTARFVHLRQPAHYST